MGLTAPCAAWPTATFAFAATTHPTACTKRENKDTGARSMCSERGARAMILGCDALAEGIEIANALAQSKIAGSKEAESGAFIVAQKAC